MTKFSSPLLLLGMLTGMSAQAREAEVFERFLKVSRELREHRSEMLTRFAQEEPLAEEDRSKGLRLYLRWAPTNNEQLRNLTLSFESEGNISRESVPIREEGDWGLVWYSALLSKPVGEIGVLRVKADVESRHFRTPFQSIREVEVFEGSLPIVLSADDTSPLRIVVQLDSDSPYSERRQTTRALKLSLISRETPKPKGTLR
ncbi:MAG: hypothetical protein ABIR96_02300 [Bdellovibrionota bacterium]